MEKINVLYEAILASKEALTAASKIDEKYNGDILNYNKLLDIFNKNNQINIDAYISNIMLEGDSVYLFLEVLIYLLKNNKKAVFNINNNYGVNNYLTIIANTILNEEAYILVHGNSNDFINNNHQVYVCGANDYLNQFSQYKNIIRINLD